jgi:hypothetical protein
MAYSLVETYRCSGETSCHNLCRDKGKFFDPEIGSSNYFEMLTSIYQTTWNYIPENGNLQTTCLKIFECVEDKVKTDVKANYKGINNINIREVEEMWKL